MSHAFSAATHVLAYETRTLADAASTDFAIAFDEHGALCLELVVDTARVEHGSDEREHLAFVVARLNALGPAVDPDVAEARFVAAIEHGEIRLRCRIATDDGGFAAFVERFNAVVRAAAHWRACRPARLARAARVLQQPARPTAPLT